MMRTYGVFLPRTSLPCTSDCHLETGSFQKNSTCNRESGLTGFTNSGLFRSLASMCMLSYSNVLPEDSGAPLQYTYELCDKRFIRLQAHHLRDVRDQSRTMHDYLGVIDFLHQRNENLEILSLLRHPRRGDENLVVYSHRQAPFLGTAFGNMRIHTYVRAIHAVHVDGLVAHRDCHIERSRDSSATAEHHRLFTPMLCKQFL